MEILLALFFIFLGIVVAIIDFAVEDKELKKFRSKHQFTDYMMGNMIIGQKGEGRLL